MAFPFWPKRSAEKENERSRLDGLDARLQEAASEEQPLTFIDCLVRRLEGAGSGPDETISRILARAADLIDVSYDQREQLEEMEPLFDDDEKRKNWSKFKEDTQSVDHVARM